MKSLAEWVDFRVGEIHQGHTLAEIEFRASPTHLKHMKVIKLGAMLQAYKQVQGYAETHKLPPVTVEVTIR